MKKTSQKEAMIKEAKMTDNIAHVFLTTTITIQVCWGQTIKINYLYFEVCYRRGVDPLPQMSIF